MPWRSVLQKLRSSLFPARFEDDLRDELLTHIDLQFRKHLADGLPESEARRRARLDFGAAENFHEECRDLDRWRSLDAALRNLKHSLRSLRRSPAYAFISILILAVGIASNVAVFSLVDALWLRPLPVSHPEQLLRVSLLGKQGGLLEIPSTGLSVLEGSRALNGVCGFDTSLPGVEIAGRKQPRGVAGFTGDCFRTLGLHLQLGRALTEADNHIGAEGVAVITDSLWQSEFGGRPDVLGQSLKIGGELYTIVGVTAKNFTGLLLGFPEPVIIPLVNRPSALPGGRKQTWYWVNILARRSPRISESQARAAVVAQSRQILEASVPPRDNAAQRKDYLSRELSVLSGRSGVDYFLRRRFGKPLYTVLVICTALLLIACVNLTGLLLSRSLGRRREVSVRLALGAKRGHIAWLFALENGIVVFAGALLGTLTGIWCCRALLAFGNRIFGNFDLPIGFDNRVALFLIAVVVAVLVVFSLASVWQAGRLSAAGALEEKTRVVLATNTFAQKMLLSAQIALTLAFVTAASLFAQSVRNMYRIDLGIDTRHLWEVELAERPNNFDPNPYYRGLLEQIKSLPDIRSASLTDVVPFLNFDYREPVASVENARIGAEYRARVIGAGDGLLGTLGVRLVAGEDFRRNDSSANEPTAILSESLARHFGSPAALLGRHVRVGDQTEYQRLKVVGIASDADLNLANLDDRKPLTVYINFWQHRDLQGYPVLLLRTQGDSLPLTAIRDLVRRKGYEYVDRVSTISEEIDNALLENRTVAYVSGVFGALALVMAAIGLFGLLSYQVASRRAEIGIRMALGARRSQIQALVLQQILQMLLFGIAAGLALTLAISKLIVSLLYGTTVTDPSTLLLSAGVLTLTALAASWIPVHRASSINPVEALRQE